VEGLSLRTGALGSLIFDRNHTWTGLPGWLALARWAGWSAVYRHVKCWRREWSGGGSPLLGSGREGSPPINYLLLNSSGFAASTPIALVTRFSSYTTAHEASLISHGPIWRASPPLTVTYSYGNAVRVGVPIGIPRGICMGTELQSPWQTWSKRGCFRFKNLKLNTVLLKSTSYILILAKPNIRLEFCSSFISTGNRVGITRWEKLQPVTISREIWSLRCANKSWCKRSSNYNLTQNRFNYHIDKKCPLTSVSILHKWINEQILFSIFGFCIASVFFRYTNSPFGCHK